MRPANEILPRTVALLEEGRRAGLHAGAQVYVSVQGATLAEVALGEARPGCPMETDTLTLWLSSGKPITAVAIAQLAERDRLSFDDSVSRLIPEFGLRGKETITIKQLLTHTAGFRAADKIPETPGWEETIARICDTPLEPEWKPGEKAGYQISSSWFVLGEIVQRLDGRSFDRYVREEIFRPLGMNHSSIGMPVETFREYGDRIGLMYLAERGELNPHPVLNTTEAITACRPASNARGPIRELARFYEALLTAGAGSDRGSSILKPETIRTLTSRHRVGLFDHTFGHTLDWGLGFLLNSNRYGSNSVPYGYGPQASSETFGHSGSQSSCAFADPERGLVVAWICNGQPGEPRHQKRARGINAAIYEDLGNVKGKT
jgi:CubicO group peptidase (beta-lactamase class C family)